jgi:L-lactate dehydrogenase complex protein LldG
MSSRDLVLGRLRAALQSAPPPPPVPREYRQTVVVPDLIGLLADRLADYKAVVHRSADIAGTVAAILAEAGPRVVVPPGLDPAWLPPAAEVLRDDGLSADTLAGLDGVVTAAAVAVAETGTIVLDASPDQGRRIISLLPDLHICVLRPEQVVASVPEALARLDPTRPLTWISGPSATSDIELDRVEGVHGPRRLHVIITSSPEEAPA